MRVKELILKNSHTGKTKTWPAIATGGSVNASVKLSPSVAVNEATKSLTDVGANSSAGTSVSTNQNSTITIFSYYSDVQNIHALEVLRQEVLVSCLEKLFQAQGYCVQKEGMELDAFFDQRQRLLWSIENYQKIYKQKNEISKSIEQACKLSPDNSVICAQSVSGLPAEGNWFKVGGVDSIALEGIQIEQYCDFFRAFFLSRDPERRIQSANLEQVKQKNEWLCDFGKIQKQVQSFLQLQIGHPDLLAENAWGSFAMDVDSFCREFEEVLFFEMKLDRIRDLYTDLYEKLEEVLQNVQAVSSPSAVMIAMMLNDFFNQKMIPLLGIGQKPIQFPS